MDIEFIEETHTYLINGIIVPSVTTLIKKIFPDKYKGISEKVLERKAKYGTLGHKVIEDIGVSMMSLEEAMQYIKKLYEIGEINQDMFISLREYARLCKRNELEPIQNEVIVNYGYEFVGTLDMIANVKGKRCLIDIKFTAELDYEYLAWQLGMYKLAYGEDFDNYYCLWLPKGKIGKLAEIKIKEKDEILNKLEEIKDE